MHVSRTLDWNTPGPISFSNNAECMIILFSECSILSEMVIADRREAYLSCNRVKKISNEAGGEVFFSSSFSHDQAIEHPPLFGIDQMCVSATGGERSSPSKIT